MMVKYPEIFDITDLEGWMNTYVRKEVMTTEWDLISKEISTDIIEIPFFTTEFCDKFIENTKNTIGQNLSIWGHECEEIDIHESVQDVIKNLFTEKLVQAFYHHWAVDLPTFQKFKLGTHIIRFKKNQDLRPRHDGSIITCYVKLDSDSRGGELYFPKYDYALQPKQGNIYFFPGRITHRYGINFIKSGINNSLFIYISDHGQNIP